MLKNNEVEKASLRLFAACWVSYMVISLSKSAYSASIASIVQEGIFDKPQAGLINAAYWAIYATAQLVGVKAINRISPIKFIAMALGGTALVNLGMAMSDSFGMMLFFWSLCGLLQFATWPAIVRILVECLDDAHKQRAMVFISFAQCAGFLVNYLSAALVLNFARWNMIFVVSMVALVATLAFWLYTTAKNVPILAKNDLSDKKLKQKEADTNIKQGKLILTSGIFFILIPAFIRGALDNGLKAWIPTMITESYGVSASFSNILTVVLLVINLSGVFICSFLYPKRIKNIFVALAICFASVVPMTVALLFIGEMPLVLVVLLLTAMTTMTYAGYQMVFVIIPAKVSATGKAGGLASVLNACSSFGVLAASYGFGYLAEYTGWTGTVTTWIIMASVAMICCLAGSSKWQKFTNK